MRLKLKRQVNTTAAVAQASVNKLGQHVYCTPSLVPSLVVFLVVETVMNRVSSGHRDPQPAKAPHLPRLTVTFGCMFTDDDSSPLPQPLSASLQALLRRPPCAPANLACPTRESALAGRMIAHVYL